MKAAIKWVRQSEKRRKRNLETKTRLKTVFKKAAAGGAQTSGHAESQFDRAAAKGIIHPNKAARKKSRLARALAAARSAAPTAAKPLRKRALKPKAG